MGLFSAIGGLFGGNSAKRASRRAEEARIEATNRGIAEDARQFDLTRADFASEQQLGEDSISAYRGLVGLDGAESQQSQIELLRQTPLYQSIYQNGQDTLLANASATGGLRGGNFQDSLARFGGDTLSDVIQNQLAAYSGGIGVGIGSDQAIGQFGANSIARQNDLRLGGAEARANGLLTRAGINNQNFQNVGGFLDNAVGTALGGGGGGIGGFLKGLF